ncbi:50S ribosomal protein L22 [Candidatus Nomurabacteria bacterium]|uniref:Large ribosomal subunit protein uL22 n=1 Tax=candidate division WWE3 bacterium TaxID=2053526 RepID=A0A955E0H8_UNCKA|nr:50S ribosomal protein L22 [candidate division WWE3 bacterium]MCB9823779.1 50S ribosomal protein L22 [Candidatus Nomurabacteria bacterium]MCB9826815.1 50S ribosomal protein L22 [Candidatus Nomurabacteria bacterium]MCB9827574.1 50S ribosomal protein L22 [Candidatus Nomurabacteria bacterium]HXK52933.1 50S ribosomal protein L22 [bacterium]
MSNAIVYAKHKYAKSSVKKVNPVLALIRGKNVAEAKRVLMFNRTNASTLILKVLDSAVANARHNLDLSEKSLVVSESYVNEGPMRKTGRPQARGRFSPIFKRSCHIVVGLDERKSE